DIKEVFEDLKTEDENIADILKEVSDITSAKPPDFSDVDEWKTKAVKKAKEMDEDLDTFTGIGDEHDVEAVLSQIESVMEQAQTSKGSARFSDFKGASNMKDLEKLQGYNEDKQAEKMDQAKDDKESTLKDIQETSSQDVVNKAYQELEDGDITYDQYTTILKSAKNTSDQMDEATIKENADEAFIDYLKDQGMLEDYLKEHETVEELEKINRLSSEEKNILNQIEKAYVDGDLPKKDYKEARSVIIHQGEETGETKNTIVDNFYQENNLVHKSNNSEHVYAVGEEQEYEYGEVSAGAGYYENDLGTSDQIGGTHTGSVLHVDGELDSDIVEGDFHQDVLKGEATAKVGGSSAFGLNLPLPLAKAEAKGYGVDGKIQVDSDNPYAGGWGVGGEANLLKAKAYGGVDEGSVGLSAKAAAAETEVSTYIPIPFTDTDAKVTLGASAGSIGGGGKSRKGN